MTGAAAMRTMTVEFVKITERLCLARARRLDGATIETTATAKGGLPHDLEHLLVEAALDCHNGFWGRVWRGAEFGDGIRVIRSGPRRRPRSWNQSLARGFTGWDEDLVGKVVAVLDQAVGRGWRPPDRLPDLPGLAVLLYERGRPPTEAVISRDRIAAAVTGLFEARREWQRLPVGGSLVRSWQAVGAGRACAPALASTGRDQRGNAQARGNSRTDGQRVLARRRVRVGQDHHRPSRLPSP
jgi:hypothetical protein